MRRAHLKSLLRDIRPRSMFLYVYVLVGSGHLAVDLRQQPSQGQRVRWRSRSKHHALNNNRRSNRIYLHVVSVDDVLSDFPICASHVLVQDQSSPSLVMCSFTCYRPGVGTDGRMFGDWGLTK